MRKFILLLSILFLTNYIAKAQSEKPNYTGIKNYINAKIIYELIKSDTNSKNINSLLLNNTLDNPVDYKVLVDNLNANKFKDTRKKICDKINSISIDAKINLADFGKAILDSIEHRLNEKQKGNCNFSQLKDRLKNEVDVFVKSKIPTAPSNETAEKSTTEDKQANLDASLKGEKDVDKHSFFSPSNFNLFTLLGMLLPIIVFLILIDRILEQKRYINSLDNSNVKRKNEIAELQSNDPRFQFPNTGNSNSKLEFDKYMDNSRVINDFRMAIEKLQSEVAMASQSTLSSGNRSNQNTQSHNSPSGTSDIFYMKYPVENSFSNAHKSMTRENTIYKFYLKPNKTEAEFEIHTEGVKIEEILSMVERAIKTGCEERNFPSSTTKNIITVPNGRGLVSLEGDKWVIKQKAVIKYE